MPAHAVRALVRRLLLVLLVIGGPGGTVSAQDAVTTLDSWRVTRFASAGLRSPIITSLTESESGRIWVSTAAGIAWFDGWRFREGRTEPNTLNRAAVALRPMRGDSVLVLMNNVLYVGDTTGLVQRPILGSLAAPTDSAEQQVRDAVWGPEGMLLLVTVEGGRDSVRLMRWSGSRAVDVPAPASLAGRGVASLHPAPGGAWLNTADGLFRLDRGRWRMHLPSGGRARRITRLVEDADGRVVASVADGSDQSGIWEWQGTDPPRRAAGEGDDELLGLAADGPNGFLAVHRGGYLRRRTAGRWAPYERGIGALADVRAALRDAVGDLWVGTGQGLLLVRESSRLWGGVPHGFPSLRDRVNALAESRDGALWAGTSDGIDIFERDGRVRHLVEAGGVPLRTITAIARDSSGDMWVGSGSTLEGALRWDGREWKHFTARDGLGAAHVHRIVVSRTGAIWFLGIGDATMAPAGDPGAFVLDSGRFRRVGPEDGLPSGRVYDFAEAPDGTRWFGTAGGLSRLRAGVWTHWRERRGRTATRVFRGTPIRVFTLDLDSTGTPWFGDSNGDFPYGLGTIEADTLRFFNMNDGLLANSVQSVRVGPDGAIWVGTTNGLSAYRDGAWFKLGTDRGLGFPQIWPILVNDSLVTIGTLGGGVRQFSLAAAATPPPRVLAPAPTIGTGVANVTWVPLAWRGSISSPLIETRLRVDGGSWGPWATARSEILPLSGGHHLVEFQAKGLYAPLNGPITSLAFDVPGPLITRPAFYLPVGALLLLLVALWVTSARRQRHDANVLRESERRFRALAGSTTEGIAIAVAGRIVDANEQLHRMVGVRDGELRGRTLAAVLGVTDGPVRDEAEPVTLTRADGSRIPAELRERAIPYFGQEARVAAVQDLSERAAARRALRESEERFETIFRQSPTAIMLTTWPEGRIVDVSDGFLDVTGRGRDELLDRTTLELELYHDPTERDRLRAGISQAGRVGGAEITVRRRDGGLRNLLGTFVRLELDGRPHVLGALTDITERRTLEAQLLQSQKMEAVGRLAGGVAHDFNNLLTVILGHADMLRSTVDDAVAVADVEDIRSAAQRAADLTRQLLTFARKQRISPRIVELGGLVQRTQRMLARLLGEGIAIEARIAADLPQVIVDAGQIEQVLVNLAVNARDAMPHGGRLTIEASGVELDEAYARDHAHLKAGRFALLAISDTGLGIPDDVLPRIFEPFYTTKEVGQGTGLGLAICYGIVREAGGHIAVYSEVGTGTTVRIYLPARPTDEEDVAEEAPAPVTVTGGTEPILVVEDEPRVRALVERALGALGYSVSTAGSLAEALSVLERSPTPPKVLVTDVVLPGANGPEVARTLRARIPDLAVLYISGYTDRSSPSTAVLDAPLLSKPFTANELGAAVRRLLDGATGP